jgi:hypothetical protein
VSRPQPQPTRGAAKVVSPRRVIVRGIVSGALVGLLLAVLYALALGLFIGLQMGGGQVNAALPFISVTVALTAVVGVPIAAILGAIEGALISALVVRFAGYVRRDAILIGALIPVWIGIAGGVILFAPNDFTSRLQLLAVPFALNIAAGIWLAARAYNVVHTGLPAAQTAKSRDRSRATPILTALLVVGPLLAGIYLVVNLFVPQTDTESHAMKWEVQQRGYCTNAVQLEFVEAPGDVISTCSPSLVTYLQSQTGNTIDVIFRRTYLRWIWRYRVLRVGEWNSSSDFDGISVICGSSAGASAADPSCGKRPLPLHSPYQLR